MLAVFPLQILLLTPFSMVRWKHICTSMVANTISLPVRACAILVSLFPFLYLVSCSCLSTARNTSLRHLFALLNTPALSSCRSLHRDKIPSLLVKIHGAVSSSCSKSLLKTRCCLDACKSCPSVSHRAGLSRDFQYSDKIDLFFCCPVPCVGLLLISTVFQLRHGLEKSLKNIYMVPSVTGFGSRLVYSSRNAAQAVTGMRMPIITVQYNVT